MIERLSVESDDVVADIEAGTGYSPFPIASRFPEGKVLEVDIQPEMLEPIAHGKTTLGARNLETVLGSVAIDACDGSIFDSGSYQRRFRILESNSRIG